MFNDVVTPKQGLPAFIATAPLVLLASSSAVGQCDVPGFVLVLDPTHLVVPYRPSNSRTEDGSEKKEFPALEWLASSCSHIPNPGEHMVRCDGYSSNVARGTRQK